MNGKIMPSVTCSKCGHALKDVSGLPCPECGSETANLALAGRTTIAGSGGATVSGHKIEEKMQKSWPYLILLVVVILGSAYPFENWTSVLATWGTSLIETLIGYYAITKIARSVRVF
jgi:hypothetical protein